MARGTYDPKERTIKARINAEMSEWVDRQCKKYGLTTTEYIRRAILAEKNLENKKEV